MPVANPLSDPQGKVDKWLRERGFTRGNPFKTTAADEERTLLAEELFVPVGDYDLIRGNRTVLVFAPRGGGKSALRIRLAAISLPEKADASTLAVECTDFSWLMEQYRRGESITESEYATFLLRQAAITLFEVFFPSPTLLPEKEALVDREQRRERAAGVSPAVRAGLAAFIRQQAPHLLTAETVYEKLCQLLPSFEATWPGFRDAVSHGRLHSLLAMTSLTRERMALLLADLCDEPVPTPDPYMTLLNHFEQLVKLGRAAGIGQVHFLIDRLDEMQLVANNYEAQAEILEPLLAYLNLMELPGLAFKFFVAQELYKVLMERPAVRRDRLMDKAVEIAWTDDLLKELLDGRLRFFSEELVPSITYLCSEAGETIEAELLRTAMGSPRRLLTGGQLLCQVRATSAEPDSLLTQQDWLTAKEQLLQLMPPVLRLQLDMRLAIKAGQPVKLTNIEVKILQALVDGGGYLPRETVVTQVWGMPDGVSDEAVDQAFKRLRDKLGDSGKQPVYLHTLRGASRGFRLEYFELSE